MAKKPETLFKEKVQRDLKKLKNVWFYKSQESTRRGVPDMIVCLNGSFIGLELKVDSPIDPLQTYVLNRIVKKGKGMAMVVDPKNWPEVYSELKALDRSEK